MLSKVAEKKGLRHSIDVAETKPLRFNWNPNSRRGKMGPDLEGDDGWLPGPKSGPCPSPNETFCGPECGVVNTSLNSESSACDFV